MSTKPLHVSLSGPNLRELLARVYDLHVFASGSPKFLSIDDTSTLPSPDWIELWVPICRRSVFAAWDESYEQFLDYSKDLVVKASNPFARYDCLKILSWLEAFPFSLAS